MKSSSTTKLKISRACKSSAGFTLVELLVAVAITGIVITVAGFGLVAILQADNKAEAQTERRGELNRALGFIADEIRMARRVNTTGDTTTTASAAVSASNPALSLGNADTLVLYLEIPITGNIPTTCPSGGPNAGSPPPQPSTYDRVIYDIRSSRQTSWLGPRVIDRYGRIPTSDGTIDPCSTPVASKALVDSISDTGTAPTCDSPAVLSGTEGFYVCVNGRKADLYINGKLTSDSGNTDTYSVNSSVFARSSP